MRKTVTTVLMAMTMTVALSVANAQAQDLLFWSTQAKPVEEAQAMRDQVLSNFDGKVDFQPNDSGPWLTRVEAELAVGSGKIGVLGALHGDFTSMADDLVDLSTLELGDIEINSTFMQLGKLGTDEQKYLPWMQATYIMAANRKALPYLPEEADVMALSYDELVEWARNIANGEGSEKFGFPAGPDGLKHRFIQGYLYPSYTDSMVTKFQSPEAVVAWETFKELWQYTNSNSTSYNLMQEPLLTEEVWVAFDHTARLAGAFNARPDDFIAFPAPAGPTGRGFMPVVAGMGIPKSAPDKEAAMKLLVYMAQPATQNATLNATSFFPVVKTELPKDTPAAVKISGAAIAAMSSAEDANPGLLPVGLGELGGQFNQIYKDAFERIVLADQDIATVLQEQALALRGIMTEAGAPCWAPDKPSDGICPVE